jgi:hypothetical protein
MPVMDITRILLVIAIILFATLVQGQDCEKLKDGNYKVKFKKSYGGATYILNIKQNRFTEIHDNKEISGDIALNEDCALRLDYPIKWDTTIQLQKVLSTSNPPYFDFQSTRGKRIRFRLTGYGGPHVTSGEGVFVKLE